MSQSFRFSMAWAHTWFGMGLSFVLMIVFFFGALSVFDREIDRWTVPQSRFEPQPMPSFDKILRPVFERMQPSKESVVSTLGGMNGPTPEYFDKPIRWGAYTTHRDPTLSVFAGFQVPNAKEPSQSIFVNWTIDPRTGQSLSDDQLKIGSQFFYPLHFSLTINWKDLGYWIVGFAALMMLVALVTGVILHRKLFRELFTFRVNRSYSRGILDLHNLTGVAALPFHFFFAYTGLVIYVGIYFPITHTQLKPLHDFHEQIESQETGLSRNRSGIPAVISSVDVMVAEAQRRWIERGMAGDVGFLGVQNVGDANGYVSVYRAGTDRIATTSEGIHFNAATGEVLYEDPERSVVSSVNEFLIGLHLQHFRHWLLRWLYFFGGLIGCVCIATGLIFFVEKRKHLHAKEGGQGARIVDAFAVTSVTGMLIATLGILVANRLLPVTLPAGWFDRNDLERYLFWGIWLMAMIHALIRSAAVARAQVNPAWHEQCWGVAVMALAAVLLNWITTGDHLINTLTARYWPVAGMDLILLLSACVALVVARRLGRHKKSRVFISEQVIEPA